MQDPPGTDRWPNGKLRLMLATVVALQLLCGGEPLRLVLELDLARGERSVPALVRQLEEGGVEGVVVRLDEDSGVPADLLESVKAAAREHAVALWLAVGVDASSRRNVTAAAASGQVTGVALIVPAPSGAPLAPADREGLLGLKAAGTGRAQSIRSLRGSLLPSCKLALCLPLPETQPETSAGRFVPVADLVRDGTLDWVLVSAAGTTNLHRLRLLRHAALSVGLHVDGRGAAAGDLGALRRAAADAVRNPTADALWVTGYEPVAALQAARDAVEGAARATAAREAVKQAIAAGRLRCDQGVEAGQGNNQATVHGVGQCFAPTRDGRCPLIQLYVTLRGCRGELPPPLRVEVRGDADGRPGDDVLGQGEIRALELAHEPEYRWGSARFDPPVDLRGGRRYWLYCPDATGPQGSYVWRMCGEGAGEHGYAWSSRYKYGPHTWLYRVYLEAAPQGKQQ